MGKNDERYAWKFVPVKSISMVRNEVRAFGEAMERKLRANDDKGGWEDCDVELLMMRLEDQMAEFQRATKSPGTRDLLAEAADVANYLMMICDRLGAFQEETTGKLLYWEEGEISWKEVEKAENQRAVDSQRTDHADTSGRRSQLSEEDER